VHRDTLILRCVANRRVDRATGRCEVACL